MLCAADLLGEVEEQLRRPEGAMRLKAEEILAVLLDEERRCLPGDELGVSEHVLKEGDVGLCRGRWWCTMIKCERSEV